MSSDHDKLDSWNRPFDLNRDGKMSPHEKALRDATIMSMMDEDDEDDYGSGGGGSTGCCLPAFLFFVGIPTGLISAIVYGIIQIWPS